MTHLATILSAIGKMAEQQGKRKGGDPEFIGVSAFSSIIGLQNQGDRFLIHSDEEYLVVTRKINIFALYNVNKHSML